MENGMLLLLLLIVNYNHFHSSMRYKIHIFLLFTIFTIQWGSLYAYTSLEEQAMTDSIKQTSPGVTTTMSPGNAVIATVVEREALIQKNMSLGLSYAEASAKVDTLYEWGGNGPKKIIVTEEVPWALCICIADDACVKTETRKYECTLDSTWLSGFQKLIAAITKWFIYITMLFGVLALVWSGILWAWGSESEEYTKKAKGWAVNIIVGLAILFTFRFILWFLAPWVFK